MFEGLGFDPYDYPHTYFPPQGVANKVGLTSPGMSLGFGKAEIWDQDYSIMGWTCGYACATARDVAKFYYDLLGPEGKIVSQERLKEMKNFTMCDLGWSANVLSYGGGLFESYPGETRSPSSYYIGHGGHTYGYQSTQGFFPALNASMSIIANQDYDM